MSDSVMEEDIERFMTGDDDDDDDMDADEIDRVEFDADEDEDEDEENGSSRELRFYPEVPVVLPRRRFAGACNVETVKDGERSYLVSWLVPNHGLLAVNFLGPSDEFVASGSDDGHVFLWKKSTGELHDILEGDGSVVNVIEDHPHLPLIAVSGIDTTVKVRTIYSCLFLPLSLRDFYLVVCSCAWPKTLLTIRERRRHHSAQLGSGVVTPRSR